MGYPPARTRRLEALRQLVANHVLAAAQSAAVSREPFNVASSTPS